MHPSRIFAALMVIFLLTVVFASLSNCVFYPPLYFTVMLLVFTVVFWKIKALRYIFLVIFVISLALLRTGLALKRSVTFKPGDQTLIATIVEEPQVKGKSQNILLQIEGSEEYITVVTTQFPTFHFGNIVEVEGNIQDPFIESPELKNFYRVQGVVGLAKFPKIIVVKEFRESGYFAIRKRLIAVRLWYEKKIGEILPDPHAGLLSGIMLGVKADIPQKTLSDLSRTGTTHIIALSGFNITIAAAFMMHLAKKFPKIYSFWLPVLGIIIFVVATNFSASVIRAAIMGILLLVAGANGRESDALISILFASCLMVYLNPLILTMDIGFQLSFTAITGLLLLGPQVEQHLGFLGPRGAEILATTIAAQLFTWPLTSYYFGTVSLIAPIANLFILPLIRWIMLLGFITSTFGYFSLWAAQKIAVVPWLLLNFVLRVTEIFSSFSLSAFNFKISSVVLIIGYYILLIELTIFLRNFNARRTQIN